MRLPRVCPQDRASFVVSRRVHLHLVSDSTGETINAVARACMVQFEGIEVVEHA